MMRDVYFDNAATTKTNEDVCELVVQAMKENYGNPSSLHMKGVQAEQYLKNTKEILAKAFKIQDKEIIFTSGGTESNNMALIGAAEANRRRGKHIITSSIEHPSVYNALVYLEENGFEVTYLPVDKNGIIDMPELEKSLRDDTILVSVLCVNNEIGTVQPIDEIGRLIKSKNEHTLFHVDAVQGFGKLPLLPKKMQIDLMSISAHKFHGPKGVGMLYIRDKVRIKPLLYGGGQQKDLRSGTENTPGIAGLGLASRLILEQMEHQAAKLYALRNVFIEGISVFEGTVINGYGVMDEEDIHGRRYFGYRAAPHIVSVSFDNIRAEVLLHALEEKGIYVSSGSACSSNHPGHSGTLKGLSIDPKYLDATIRFSFCYETTKEEIDYCLECLAQIIPTLRRYTPGGRKVERKNV